MNRIMENCMRTLKLPWLLLCLTTLLAAAPRYARANDWTIDTKINFVEGTYIPTGMYLWVKTPPPASAGCHTDNNGTVLAYRGLAAANVTDRKENIKAVYASLVNAAGAGLTVRIGGLNQAATPNDQCNVQLIYFSHR